MGIGQLYLIVGVVAVVLAGIAYAIDRGSGRFAVGFTLMEIVITAVIGVINGVLGTPNATLGRLFMTFSGSYGFLAFAASRSSTSGGGIPLAQRGSKGRRAHEFLVYTGNPVSKRDVTLKVPH